MASSGDLARALALVLGLPEASIATVMRALRNDNMITMKGRGTSAAAMTSTDAAVVLTAICSGAVTSQIADVTNRLLRMRHVASFVSRDLTGLDQLEALGSRLFRLSDSSIFIDALTVLLDENSPISHYEDDGPTPVHALYPYGKLNFELWMDPMKVGGLAMIKAYITSDITITKYYSSWNLKREAMLKPFEPSIDSFEVESSFLSGVRLSGSVFAKAISSLGERVTTTRTRQVAGKGRR
ncbi:hypothetical protein V1282_003554 [Nitrobacteraceae bacterium AZCC 2146]